MIVDYTWIGYLPLLSLLSVSRRRLDDVLVWRLEIGVGECRDYLHCWSSVGFTAADDVDYSDDPVVSVVDFGDLGYGPVPYFYSLILEEDDVPYFGLSAGMEPFASLGDG